MSKNLNMTVEAVREHAKIMELHALNFLDVHGNCGARCHNIKTIHLVFIDGNEARLSPHEFARLVDVRFMLRPTRNDS